jgi:orotate phosphoribosyltransferase
MLQLQQYRPTVLMGAPMGGIGLAFATSMFLGTRTIFAEKKFVAMGPEREETRLVFVRHELEPDDRVVIVEDVCNNFSTTEQLIRLVRMTGATVATIACALNRAPLETFHSPGGIPLNVRSIIHNPSPQYRQDDPAVRYDVQAGNVAWKPKTEWDRLMAVMRQSVRKG